VKNSFGVVTPIAEALLYAAFNQRLLSTSSGFPKTARKGMIEAIPAVSKTPTPNEKANKTSPNFFSCGVSKLTALANKLIRNSLPATHSSTYRRFLEMQPISNHAAPFAHPRSRLPHLPPYEARQQSVSLSHLPFP